MDTSRCSIPTSGQVTFSLITFLVFLALEALVGMVLNAFIVAVSCVDGTKNKQLKSVDKILTALAITRFCYLHICLIKIFWMSVSSRVFIVTNVYQIFKAAVWSLTSVCFWFSACLCSFYCIKIANFGHRLFVQLKLRISSLVPWMLVVSVFASLINALPFFRGIYSMACRNSTGSGTAANQTLDDLTWETNLLSLFVYCGMGFSVAFSISVASSCLLLFSLWQHTHRIQNGSASFGDPSMAAHFQAVKTIMSLLIVDSVNFVGLMILLSNTFSERGPTYQFLTILVNVCPSAQSQIIIWSNPKLKRAFIRLLSCIKHMSWV